MLIRILTAWLTVHSSSLLPVTEAFHYPIELPPLRGKAPHFAVDDIECSSVYYFQNEPYNRTALCYWVTLIFFFLLLQYLLFNPRNEFASPRCSLP